MNPSTPPPRGPGDRRPHSAPPQGRRRHSAAVYRRRRIVMAVAAVLVLALVVTGVVLGIRWVSAMVVSSHATPAPVATAAATAEPSAEPEPTDAAEPTEVVADGPCEADDIGVRAEVSGESFEGDDVPELALVVKNESDRPCSIDVGTAQQEFIVKRGGDKVWSSADCQDVNADARAARVELAFAAGAEKRSIMEWPRIASEQGCVETDIEIEPGDYELTVSLGAQTSKVAGFELK